MATSGWFLLVVAALYSRCAYCETRLGLDFESPYFVIGRGQTSLYRNALLGDYSVLVSNRDAGSSFAKPITVEGASIYKLICNILPTNIPAKKMFGTAEAKMKLCSSGFCQRISFGKNTRLRPGVWTMLGGVNKLPNGPFDSALLYIEALNAELNYAIDDCTLTQINETANWQSDADARITAERISSPTFVLNMGNGGKYDIEVKQKKLDFGFGSTISPEKIADPAWVKYQTMIFNNYDWASMEPATAWKTVEPVQNQYDLSNVGLAVDTLKENSMKIRGHMPARKSYEIPPWVRKMDPKQFRNELEELAIHLANYSKTRFTHWSIPSLREPLFEESSVNPEQLRTLFEIANEYDNELQLFLDDPNVLQDVDNSVVMFLSEAMRLKAKGVPIHGLGVGVELSRTMNWNLIKVQSKGPTLVLRDIEYFEVTEFEERLELLAEAGIPIWITELAVCDPDVSERGTLVGEAMEMFYSLIDIEGIVFNFIWDSIEDIYSIRKDCALFEGENATQNAAGTKYTAMRNLWKTEPTFQAANGAQVVKQLHKGEYDITVKKGGATKLVKTVTITENSPTITLQNLQTVPVNIRLPGMLNRMQGTSFGALQRV